MKYLSVCSGIEAASVAFKPLGWEALAFSEIEAFPRAVLAHHYPEVPLHGDFTELRHMPFIVDADLLCGGTPCQSFSIAGLRKSMSDDRGNLTLQFILLADAIDNLRSTAGRQPAYVLWENVPGVFSTSDNAFGAFLGGLCGRDAAIPEPADGWPSAGVVDGPTRVAAWRVLDAQHFGLAQRRKRVFVLAKGGAGRWTAADALLPIIESLRWHSAPSRGKEQRAPTIPSRSTAGGGLGTDFDCDGGLVTGTAPGLHMQGVQGGERRDVVADVRVVRQGADLVPEVAGTMIARAHSDAKEWPAEIAPTLNASFGDKQGLEDQHALNGAGLFVPVFATDGQSNAAFAQDQALALNASNEQPYIAAPMLVRMREGKEGGGKGPLVSKDQSLTLATANDQVLAIAPALTASNDPSRSPQSSEVTQQVAAVHRASMQVRRLTPVECERLQGFPIVRQMLYIAACLDPASGSVDVALRCHRLQSSVWPADANELMQFAATAEEHSNTPQASQEPLVLARVLMHSEAKVQEFRSAGKLIWSARSADEQSECHQLTRVETIAHALARHGHVVAKEIMDGKEASPQNTSGSSHRKNGEVCVTLSIAGTKANAGDATNDHRGDGPQFTTSELGQVIPKEDSTLATALCSVLHAIAGSIPEQTLPENFSIAIEVGRGYTNIPWRGKPAAPDGPRYKALGNSWAVPVVGYIGERIKAVMEQ